MRFSQEEKRDEVEKVLIMTRGWLATFGQGSKTPRPIHECEVKQRRLAVLREVFEDYQNEIDRRRGAV